MTDWGPVSLGDGRWRLRLWAPDCQLVILELQDGTALPMAASADGWFVVEIEAEIGSCYRFRLGDDCVVPDPASRRQSGGVHGWSQLARVPPPHGNWTGRPFEETVIYELHAGLLGGYTGIIDRIPGLAAIGITAIELMPINAFSGERNWGYDGVLPFAPAESYGSIEDLRALIDTAHDHGLMVFLDVVYNHFGPDGNYLNAYASSFFDSARQTPWGGAIAVERKQVANFFRENALMWIIDYGFDGLRFDAVHAIGNDAFLDQLAQAIRTAAAGRHVHLMLENERNDAERLAPGRFDAQWNDDFHNVMHVLLSGETDAYYEDFAQAPAEKLARCLAEGFIYQGAPSPHQGNKARGTASAHLPPSSFIAFLQNHDQTGNRALGERLTALVDIDRLKAATALLLLMPQIPLLFMGEETGATSPFLFFTDFHDDLADAVREGRRQEFSKFAAFAEEEARTRIPDPNAVDTFEMSKIMTRSDEDTWRAFYSDLLELRRSHIVPVLRGTRAIEARALSDAAVVASWRLASGATLTLLLNLGAEGVAVPVENPALFSLGTPGAPASFSAWLG